MKPLLQLVVALCLLLAANAHPENIEEIKELPQTKDTVLEADETEAQARVERCTTCTGNVKLKLTPNDILGALRTLPPGQVHTEQSFEGCSTEKGCAGVKVKDGRIVERFGNADSFKAAAAANIGEEYTFHAAGAPFWWMNENSPFKTASANYEQYKSSSSSFSSTGSGAGATGSGGFGASFDLSGNPFFNGALAKPGNGFTSSAQDTSGNGKLQSTYESSSFSGSNKGDADFSNNAFLNGGFQSQGGFAQGAGQSSFTSGGSGYVGSSPRPFTASTASNVNFIQNSQKTNEYDYEQNQQSFENDFQSCVAQGYVCVPRNQCNNGVVSVSAAGTKKQSCETRTEVCCRIDASLQGTQNGFGSSSTSFGSSFGAQGSSNNQGGFSTSGFGSSGSGSFGSTNITPNNQFGTTSGYKGTSQSNFVDTDAFQSGSDSFGVFRPGASGSGLKPGVPYLPPDINNSPSNVVTSTAFPSTNLATTPRPTFTTPRPTFTTPRPTFTTPRPTFTTPKPTYRPTTSAPAYLPPQVGQPTNTEEVRVPGPNYVDGQLILDENRFPKPKPTPGISINTIPVGCAAALKCTPIEFCTAEGVISTSPVILNKDQQSYRVPLTDCKTPETGVIGKCCRDPNYTDPWPTNQLGQWVQGVFGGNDGKYVPDNRGSDQVRPQSSPRPNTGSINLNSFITPKPTTTPFGPNQVTPGYPSSTVTQGTYQKGSFGQGQFTQKGQGTYSQKGQGQIGQSGQGQFGQGSQGQFGQGSKGQFGQGSQGQIGIGGQSSTTTATGQFGKGTQVTQAQGQFGTPGQGQFGIQGQGQFGTQGQGQFGTQSQGQFGTQGQGQFGTQGQGQFGTQGQGQLVTQGQGQFGTQGQGQFGKQGQFGQGNQQFGGQLDVQQEGSQSQFTQVQKGVQGQGQIIKKGEGQTITQGQGFGVNRGTGQTVTTGQGTGVRQNQGFGVATSQGVSGVGQVVNRGQGVGIAQVQVTGVTQGQGFGVSRGQGQITTQGQGFGVAQNKGQAVTSTGQIINQGIGVTQTPGFGVTRGQGQFVSQGQGQLVSRGQGAGVTQGQGAGVVQGQGVGVSQGQTFGVKQGQGSSTIRGQGVVGQGQIVGQGQTVGVAQGQGFEVSRGEGQLVTQGQGVGVSQSQGVGGTRGEGQIVLQGQGLGATRAPGFGTTQNQFAVGEGQGINQGFGFGVSQGKGQGVITGQGQLVSQGQGQFVSQGQGLEISRGEGQIITQGEGVGLSQGQGQFVSRGQGFGSSQGFGVGGEGQFGSQGVGFGVQGGQGLLTSQGFGAKLQQEKGTLVSQGSKTEVENEFGESVQRVFLKEYNPSSQCGRLNGQAPYGNHDDQEVDFAQIPWQAMVLLQTNRSLLCGGVITRPDVVITSAACVDGLQAKNVLIKGGEYKLGVEEEPLPFQIVQVKHILRHPYYKAGSLHYDAAILVLEEDLNFAKNIYPICLPGFKQTLESFYEGKGECIVTGWGKVVLQAHLEGAIMHSMNVSLIRPNECQAKITQDYPHLLEQYDEDSCVCGEPSNPLDNICRVDIGSALACTTGDGHFVMRGVYSWDSGCQPGNQLVGFYKFDMEWYEWAIGLIESIRFSKFGVGSKVSQNKITTTLTTGSTSSKGYSEVGKLGQDQVRLIPNIGEFNPGQVSGQFGQFGQFTSGKYTEKNSGAIEPLDLSGNPISNTFSATYSEKKVYQSEPKIISFTTKPEIVTFTTKPEIVTFTTKPEYFTFTTKPKIVTYTTKPEIFTYTTKPKIVTYTTKPEIVTYTTKPKLISYAASATNEHPSYAVPGVSFNPSFTDVIGKKHDHSVHCKCLDGKK